MSNTVCLYVFELSSSVKDNFALVNKEDDIMANNRILKYLNIYGCADKVNRLLLYRQNIGEK